MLQYYVCNLPDCSCKGGLLKSNEITFLNDGSPKDCGVWYSNAVSVMTQLTSSFSGSILPEHANLKKCLTREDKKAADTRVDKKAADTRVDKKAADPLEMGSFATASSTHQLRSSGLSI